METESVAAKEESIEDIEDFSARVADLLTEAGTASDAHVRVESLRTVSSMILHEDPTLLDNFLEEILAFKSDRAADVRKFVAEFIEESTKLDVNLLTTFLPLVALFLGDTNSGVIKRAILCHAQLYKVTLRWIAGMKGTVDEKTRIIWNTVVTMKDQIFRLLESTNQGIRSHVIKFMEHIALALSHKNTDSEPARANDLDVSLDLVKSNHSYLRYADLKLEGSKIIQVFLTLITSPQVTCSNLLVAINCLVSIARQRPLYMAPVIQSLESVHVNLPPSLSKSQVASVRKNLKLQLSQIVKHAAIPPYISQISTLLTDLGASQSEINKMVPKPIRELAAKLKKEKEEQQLIKPSSKKVHLDDQSSSVVELEQNKRVAAIDITTEHLVPRLKRPETVANIVLLSMLNLPDSIPAHFQSTYTPIDSAGTPAQIEHLARLMATQMTAAGVGVGVEKVAKEESRMAEAKKQSAAAAAAAKSRDESTGARVTSSNESSSVSRVHHSTPAAGEEGKLTNEKTSSSSNLDTKQTLFTAETLAANLQMKDPTKRNVKVFNFREAAVTIPHEELDLFAKSCLKRILYSEKKISQCGAGTERSRVLASLAILHEGSGFEDEIENFVLDDIKSRYELIISWLFQLYNRMQRCSESNSHHVFLSQYEKLVVHVMKHIMKMPDKDGTFLTKLFVEAPILTNTIFSTLSRYCTVDECVPLCISTLSEVVMKRSSHMKVALNYLLLLTTLDHHKARSEALKLLIHLYTNDKLGQHKTAIENFATMRMESVMETTPPDDLLDKTGRPYPQWTEDAIKQCLFLYLGLLPLNHSLVLPVVQNYTLASNDVKKTLLRIIETPVRSMGQDSAEIQRVLQSCPKGCETLIIRMLHVLTEPRDSAASTAQGFPKLAPALLSSVKALYKQSDDVRFLIPVLSGLKKNEVLEALPKLIKLSPELVKEVFRRLIAILNRTDVTGPEKVAADDVFVALHKIEGADLKSAIAAVNLCVAEEATFNETVVAISMTTLLELKTLPTLIMRTVLQTLNRHPRLKSFMLNTVLQRLVVRSVWKLPRLWDGFIRCVQKTTPDSFAILLQLPSEQLLSVFSTSEELKNGLMKHWSTLPTYQKSQVLPSLQQLLNAPPSSIAPQNQSQDSIASQSQDTVEEASKKRTNESRQSTPTEDDIKNENQRTSGESNDDPDGISAKRVRTESNSDDQYTPEDFIAMMESFCSDLIDDLANEICAEEIESIVDEIVAEVPTEEVIFNDLVEEFLSNEAFSVALESKTELELAL